MWVPRTGQKKDIDSCKCLHDQKGEGEGKGNCCNYDARVNRIFYDRLYSTLTCTSTSSSSRQLLTIAELCGRCWSVLPRVLRLLPLDGNHDVPVFKEVPAGRFVNETPPEPTYRLDAVTEHFWGRAVDVQKVRRSVS